MRINNKYMHTRNESAFTYDDDDDEKEDDDIEYL
jgi:hypothetical protein